MQEFVYKGICVCGNWRIRELVYAGICVWEFVYMGIDV
ncbi:hypothetical protein EDD76_102372 [Kineothrix alysoides]|uniref:Uncharacterized protein n=1 Tax=Kineothrix alysoides TaxID=1469948 RepID=A0A4R1R5U7_9FIRM|nr:hypothetical protein EDD76_102372 [Kineothrix alysoides]